MSIYNIHRLCSGNGFPSKVEGGWGSMLRGKSFPSPFGKATGGRASLGMEGLGVRLRLGVRLLLFFLFFTLTASAGHRHRNDEVSTTLHVGVQGGVNLTRFSFSAGDFDTENRTGWFAGPTLRFHLPVIGLGVDAAALYDQRDLRLEGEKVRLQNIDVPLNLRYSVGFSNAFNVFVAAGPQVSFNLGSKTIRLDDDYHNYLKNNVNWRIRDTQFSVNVGGGIVINHVQLGVRYNIPIGKTNDLTWDDAFKKTFHASEDTKCWQLSLAYYF